MAVAMWKEYFDAHFFPERHTRREWLLSSLAYWLVALFFDAFPLPQTEAGARQSLRYVGDLVSEGWSILFFPEGERTEAGEIHPFQPGIGLIASRLGLPVVPIRLRGFDKVLHRHEHWPRPSRVQLVFGPPLHLKGEDYIGLSKRVEGAVTTLWPAYVNADGGNQAAGPQPNISCSCPQERCGVPTLETFNV